MTIRQMLEKQRREMEEEFKHARPPSRLEDRTEAQKKIPSIRHVNAAKSRRVGHSRFKG